MFRFAGIAVVVEIRGRERRGEGGMRWVAEDAEDAGTGLAGWKRRGKDALVAYYVVCMREECMAVAEASEMCEV